MPYVPNYQPDRYGAEYDAILALFEAEPSSDLTRGDIVTAMTGKIGKETVRKRLADLVASDKLAEGEEWPRLYWLADSSRWGGAMADQPPVADDPPVAATITEDAGGEYGEAFSKLLNDAQLALIQTINRVYRLNCGEIDRLKRELAERDATIAELKERARTAEERLERVFVAIQDGD